MSWNCFLTVGAEPFTPELTTGFPQCLKVLLSEQWEQQAVQRPLVTLSTLAQLHHARPTQRILCKIQSTYLMGGQAPELSWDAHHRRS